MHTCYEVRCHETGDDSDYLIKTFATRHEAEAYIQRRNVEHPQDQLYEHWYIKQVETVLTQIEKTKIAMKKLFLVLAAAMGCMMNIQAQTPSEPFLTDETRPDGTAFIPTPPEILSSEFYNDFYYYEWGKSQREDADEVAWAIDDETVSLNIAFSEVLGIEISEENTPEIFKLVERAKSDAHKANSNAKNFFKRTRPFAIFKDATPRPEIDEQESTTFSYPSGHSSRGWMYALTLCTVAPEKAEALNVRAQIYALHRVIMGRHWKSDIDNSLLLTATVFAAVSSSDAYQEQLAKAKAEYAEKKTQVTSVRSTIETDRKAIQAFYDLAGRRAVAPTAPGLYIQDGKKVFVK